MCDVPEKLHASLGLTLDVLQYQFLFLNLNESWGDAHYLLCIVTGELKATFFLRNASF